MIHEFFYENLEIISIQIYDKKNSGIKIFDDKMVIFFFKRKDELKSKNVILLYSNNYITFLLHRENYYKIMFLTYSLNDLDILLYLLQALICYFYFFR